MHMSGSGYSADKRGSKYGAINDSTTAGQTTRSVDSGRATRAAFVRGLLLAVLVGLCGGSTLVPIKFSPVGRRLVVLQYDAGLPILASVCCDVCSATLIDLLHIT